MDYVSRAVSRFYAGMADFAVIEAVVAGLTVLLCLVIAAMFWLAG